MSFILIVSGFLLIAHGIGGNASHTWVTTQLECQILLWTAVPTSSIFKSIIYTLFTARIWESFGDSGMGYSKRLLTIWTVTLIMWSVFNSVLNITFSKVESVNDTCKYEFFVPMLMSVMLLDFVSLLVNTYLFVKPIYLINQMMKQTVNDKSHVIVDPKQEKLSELKLKQIAIKQFLLSLTAMISTMIAYPGIIMFELAQVWGCIDTVISTFCIVVMYRWHNELTWKLFNKFCCCCCRKWMKFHEDMKAMETEIVDKNKQTMDVVPTKTEDTQTMTAANSGIEVAIR